jgi:hypothetical protein
MGARRISTARSILLMMAHDAIVTAMTRLSLSPKPSSSIGEYERKPLVDLINWIAYEPMDIRF